MVEKGPESPIDDMDRRKVRNDNGQGGAKQLNGKTTIEGKSKPLEINRGFRPMNTKYAQVDAGFNAEYDGTKNEAIG